MVRVVFAEDNYLVREGTAALLQSSEEVNLVMSGSGIVVSDGEEAEFGSGSVMWVPKGVHHQHRNTGTEPLKLLWVYSPQAELPTS